MRITDPNSRISLKDIATDPNPTFSNKTKKSKKNKNFFLFWKLVFQHFSVLIFLFFDDNFLQKQSVGGPTLWIGITTGNS